MEATPPCEIPGCREGWIECVQEGYQAVRECACRRVRIDADRRRRRGAHLPDAMAWGTWKPKRTRILRMDGTARRPYPHAELMRWRPTGLAAPLIFGGTRLGKTHVMVAIARALIADPGIAALYVNLHDLWHRERRYIDTPEPSGHPVDHAAAAPLLLADDLGADRLTSWVLEGLYHLVDTRIRACRPTVWASNLSPKGLERYFATEGGAGVARANASRVWARIRANADPVLQFAPPGSPP